MTRRVPAALMASGTVILAPMFAVPAQAQEVKGNVTLMTGVGYNTNPFLVDDNATGSASLDAEVRPELKLIESRGQLEFQGYYRRKEYFRRYDGTDGFGGTLSGSYRINERTTFSSTVDYSDAILDAATLLQSGLYGFGSGGSIATPSVPGSVNPVPGLGPGDALNGDVGLIGLRQRRAQLNSTALLDFRPNTTDTWGIGLLATDSRYPGAVTATSYRSVGGFLSYTRQLSALSSVGATANVQSISYAGAARSSRIYSPQVTYSTRFSQSWSLEAGAGLSIVDDPSDTSRVSTISSAFQLSLCRDGPRVNVCLAGNRNVSPAGIGRLNVQSAIRLTYGYRISEKSSLDVNAGFNAVANPAVSGIGGSQRFIAADISYGHDLNRHVQFVAQLTYQSRDPSIGSVSADVGGRIGLVTTLGKRDEYRRQRPVE